MWPLPPLTRQGRVQTPPLNGTCTSCLCYFILDDRWRTVFSLIFKLNFLKLSISQHAGSPYPKSRGCSTAPASMYLYFFLLSTLTFHFFSQGFVPDLLSSKPWVTALHSIPSSSSSFSGHLSLAPSCPPWHPVSTWSRFITHPSNSSGRMPRGNLPVTESYFPAYHNGLCAEHDCECFTRLASSVFTGIVNLLLPIFTAGGTECLAQHYTANGRQSQGSKPDLTAMLYSWREYVSPHIYLSSMSMSLSLPKVLQRWPWWWPSHSAQKRAWHLAAGPSRAVED